jgi:hypothetical protein
MLAAGRPCLYTKLAKPLHRCAGPRSAGACTEPTRGITPVRCDSHGQRPHPWHHTPSTPLRACVAWPGPGLRGAQAGGGHARGAAAAARALRGRVRQPHRDPARRRDGPGGALTCEGGWSGVLWRLWSMPCVLFSFRIKRARVTLKGVHACTTGKPTTCIWDFSHLGSVWRTRHPARMAGSRRMLAATTGVPPPPLHPLIDFQAFRRGLCRGLHACHVQVQLAPSAVAADGSGAAAATGVPGGNRARVRDGVALFKDVRIVAERPGTFSLAAKTASRKARAPPHCGPGVEYRVGTAIIPVPHRECRQRSCVSLMRCCGSEVQMARPRPGLASSQLLPACDGPRRRAPHAWHDAKQLACAGEHAGRYLPRLVRASLLAELTMARV